jgi:hypothetical protein
MNRRLHLLSIVMLFVSMGYGQILFTARMDGSQETPPVTTTASGTGAFVLNSDGTALSYTITITGLTITAAHFHNGAVGVAAAVVKNLTFVNNTATGVWSSTDATQPLTDSLLSELLRGRLYVNAHTTANPGGEIRGQVLQVIPVEYYATMNGSQETPPTTSTATGSASVILAPGGSVSYRVTVAGLTPTAAHFHNGPLGVAAGVVKNISLVNNSASGSWTPTDATQPLTDALLRDLAHGRMYVNAHTTAFPGGEIRGQVVLGDGIGFTAAIDGSQETPPVTTSASGTGAFRLINQGTQLNYVVTFTGLTPTAAHFHNGPVGVGAGVVKNLTIVNGSATGSWNSADATQPFTDSMLVELLHGRLYVNAHTTANPGGEIRGQVLQSAGAGVAVTLSGSQETPPVATNASGSASVYLNPDLSVTYNETVTGLTPTAAHFHDSPVGVAGGVVKNISFTNNTASGTWTSSDASQPLTDLLLKELVKGRLYLNAHTTTNPGGEIRGQVTGPDARATSVERITTGQVPTNYRLDQNYPNPFNPSTEISFQLSAVSNVKLKVFDLLGREVATLIDGVREPGAYKVSFNASSLTSGVYFYTLQADGATIQTKKMLLLK